MVPIPAKTRTRRIAFASTGIFEEKNQSLCFCREDVEWVLAPTRFHGKIPRVAASNHPTAILAFLNPWEN
jgi:hypothetical protein